MANPFSPSADCEEDRSIGAAVLGPGQRVGDNVHLTDLNNLPHDHRLHDDEPGADLDADAGAPLRACVPPSRI